MSSDHECTFPEVVIGEDHPAGPLKPGMKVLAPCECGETPLDELQLVSAEWKGCSDALVAVDPHRLLYHWAPTVRRKQIIRFGLRPRMRITTSIGDGPAYRPASICLADSPSWAWALSGGMRWSPAGEWDLWQTSIDRLDDPVVIPTTDRPSGIYEVRTTTRVFKRDLWLVGSRTKT